MLSETWWDIDVYEALWYKKVIIVTISKITHETYLMEFLFTIKIQS